MVDQLTLTAYADQVRELIRNDRNDEAVAICKHVLRYYPKYVDAYRQLGEALLEKGQHDDAKELFRRVLSADPESVVAYAGLAVILEQEHLVAEAAWHMERAYEIAPGNTELHEELHRLYHELDGRPRGRLKLTPGALARLYVQEGFFAQALEELNGIIAESPARFDARIALAETLWRIGQMRQAAEIAQALLESLPYCLKANLILGTVWKETGLSESDQYLQRAQSLDPTNQIAHRLFGARSPLPPTQARVPRYVEGAPLEPPPSPAAPMAETVAPLESIAAEQAREPEPFIGPALKPPVLDTTLPPWLRMPSPEIVQEQVAPTPPAEPIAETPAEAMPRVEQAAEPQPKPAVETTIELPQWLAQLRKAAEPSAETMAQVPAEEAAPTIPSWIEEARSAETTAPPPEPKEEPQIEAVPALPPWVTAESRAEEAAPAQPAAKPPAEEMPPWLRQPAPVAEEAAPAQSAPKPPAEEMPPWLRQPAPVAEEAAPVVPKRKRATRGDSHLVLARTYRDANQMKESLAEYDYVVQKAPRLVHQAIGDLEALSTRPGVPLEVHRILGDAYTRADRLAEALEEYRFVLEHIS